MGKLKYEWVERGLIESPFYIGLCLDEESFKKTLKRLQVEEMPNFLPNDADACVHTFERLIIKKKNRRACVVCVHNDVLKYSLIEAHGILVHEAVHVWQKIRDYIGEYYPSIEFEAYSIQSISQNLMESYKKLTKDANSD